MNPKEKYYLISVKPLPPVELYPERQELHLTIVLSPNRSIHLIWYSSPIPNSYNNWDFVHMIVADSSVDILIDRDVEPLLQEIAAVSDKQPQEFEACLKTLGFNRR